MKAYIAFSTAICMTLNGCTAANFHWSETPAWAADLNFEGICVQSAITPGESDKGRLLISELRKRQWSGSFDMDECARTGQKRARELAEFKQKSDDFFRGVGTVMAIAIGVAAVGAVGYYSGRAQAPYVPPVISQVPSAPYLSLPPSVPLTPITTLVRQEFNNSFSSKKCVYSGTSSVMLVQPHETCPPNLPTATSPQQNDGAIPLTRPNLPQGPYVPIPLAYYLTSQNVDKAYTTKVCAYGGTSTVIIMAAHEVCPASVPR